MTNLVGNIVVVVVTNWTLSSTEIPVISPDEQRYLVYRPIKEHYTVSIFSNVWFETKFEGESIKVLLKSNLINYWEDIKYQK